LTADPRGSSPSAVASSGLSHGKRATRSALCCCVCGLRNLLPWQCFRERVIIEVSLLVEFGYVIDFNIDNISLLVGNSLLKKISDFLNLPSWWGTCACHE
jgi:hypothetical protein